MSYVTDRQLGFIDPTMFGIAIDVGLNYWDQKKVQSLVPDFPGIFERAVVDFAKFKAGVKAGLFSSNEQQEIMAWFAEFPRLWESIRLNFIKDREGQTWGGRVDDFIGSIRRSEVYRSSGLGLAPVLIAGVIIFGGVAAGLWAVSYIQRQANLSKMIDQVTAGALPAEVLLEAVKAEQSGGFFGGLGSGLMTLVGIGVAGFLGYKFIGKK